MLNSSKSITNLNDYEIENEKDRKTRLIRLFCRIIMLGTLGYAVSEVISLITKTPINISIIAGIVLLFLIALASHQLAGRGSYVQASWLLVITSTLVVIGINFQFGADYPMQVALLLPIAMAAVLLNGRATLLIAVICISCNIGLTTAQNILKIYTPLVINTNVTLAKYFMVLVVLPGVLGIMVAPARAQNRALKLQNQKLKEALDQLKERQSESSAVSSEVSGLASELRTTSNVQASGSQEQASSIAQVNVSMQGLTQQATKIVELSQEVDSRSQQMLEASQQIEKTTIEVANQSQQGLASMEEVINISQSVASLYQGLLENFSEFRTQSTDMRRVLDLLRSIANETHLLSLNAAIEAAGAGIYGERFAIVAREVKTLAERAALASVEVVGLVRGLEQVNFQAADTVSANYEQVIKMKEVTYHASSVIEMMRHLTELWQEQAVKVRKNALEVKEVSQVIQVASYEQSQVSGEVLASLSKLNEVAARNTETSQDILEVASVLENLAQTLKSSFYQNHSTKSQ